MAAAMWRLSTRGTRPRVERPSGGVRGPSALEVEMRCAGIGPCERAAFGRI